MDITKNDQTVKCEGTFNVNEPAFECSFDNDEFDCIFTAGEATTWGEAVDHMTLFAINNDIILLEMIAHDDIVQEV